MSVKKNKKENEFTNIMYMDESEFKYLNHVEDINNIVINEGCDEDGQYHLGYYFLNVNINLKETFKLKISENYMCEYNLEIYDTNTNYIKTDLDTGNKYYKVLLAIYVKHIKV